MSKSTQMCSYECTMPDGSKLQMYKSPEPLNGLQRITQLDGKIILQIGQQEWFCMTDIGDFRQKFGNKFLNNRYYWVCTSYKLVANQNFTFIINKTIVLPSCILFRGLTLRKIHNDLLYIFTIKSQLQLTYRYTCQIYGDEIGAKWKNACKVLLFSKNNPLPRLNSHPAAVPILNYYPIVLIPGDCLRKIMVLVIQDIYLTQPNNWKIIIRFKLVCKKFNEAIITIRCQDCLKQILIEHPGGRCDECLKTHNLKLRNGVCNRCHYVLTNKDIKDSWEKNYCLECAIEREQIRCVGGRSLEDDD